MPCYLKDHEGIDLPEAHRFHLCRDCTHFKEDFGIFPCATCFDVGMEGRTIASIQQCNWTPSKEGIMTEESDKVKELKKKILEFEEKLKECSTQHLIVMQAEILNELANRYNKEGGINPK